MPKPKHIILRAKAEHARAIATRMNNPRDRELMIEYHHELEIAARASEDSPEEDVGA